MHFRKNTLPAVMALSLCLMLWHPVAHAITPEAYSHYQTGVQMEKHNDFRGAETEYRTALGLDPYDSLTYLKLGYLVERDDKKDEALQLYQKALELNPKDTMIHLSIAQLYESKNQPDKAAEQYQQLLKENPGYSYAYLALARDEKQLKHQPESIAAYQAFLKSYPTHYDAQRELAALLLVDKQYDKAAETYKTLKATNADKFKDDLAYGISLNQADKSQEALDVFQNIKTPSAVLYEQMGISYEKLNRLTEAYNSYAKAVDVSPKEQSELYLKMADIAITQNQPENAINALQSYLKYHPDNAKVTKSLADLYMQKKDYPAAAGIYQDALSKLPETDKTFRNDALRNLGYVYQMQGDLDKAVDSYEKSLALEDNEQTRLNLALAYHKQGNFAKAADLYRKLLVNDPKSTTVRQDLGQVLLALGDQSFKSQDYKGAMEHYQDAFLLGDTQELPALLGLANTQYALKNYQVAYTTYQRILEKDPENIMARLNKAQLDLDQKNYMPALENLRWIVEKKPDFFEAYRLLAQTHEGLGDYGQAITYYKKALEIHPNDPNLLVGYGNAWRQVGDLDRAVEAYELARTQSPADAMVHYNLASVYNLKNNLDASLTEYRAAIQLDPSFTEPYYGMGATYEKQKKYGEALEVYQQFIDKAPPTSSYLPLAKERIEYLKKNVKQPATAPAAAKQPAPTQPAQKK